MCVESFEAFKYYNILHSHTTLPGPILQWIKLNKRQSMQKAKVMVCPTICQQGRAMLQMQMFR